MDDMQERDMLFDDGPNETASPCSSRGDVGEFSLGLIPEEENEEIEQPTPELTSAAPRKKSSPVASPSPPQGHWAGTSVPVSVPIASRPTASQANRVEGFEAAYYDPAYDRMEGSEAANGNVPEGFLPPHRLVEQQIAQSLPAAIAQGLYTSVAERDLSTRRALHVRAAVMRATGFVEGDKATLKSPGSTGAPPAGQAEGVAVQRRTSALTTGFALPSAPTGAGL